MIRRLLFLNGLAVLAAVCYHASAWGFIAMFWWTDRYRPVQTPNFDQFGSLAYWVLRALEQIVIFGVPAFLFVSGLFLAFAAGRTQKLGWNLVLARLKNLILPYLVWSIVLIGLDLILGQPWSTGGFILTLLTGRAADPYYYIPVIVQLYLLSPVLILLASSRWKLTLLLTGALQGFVVLLRYLTLLNLESGILTPFLFLTRSFLFPGYIFFFSLGIVIGFHYSSFKASLVRWRWWLLALLICLFLLGIMEWELLLEFSGESWLGPKETLVDNFYAILFILVFLSFDSIVLPFNRSISQIGTKSYGVYLVHSVILLYTAKLVYHIFPDLLSFPLIFVALLIVVGLGVPLVLMELINRSPARRYYGIFFG